MEDDGGSEESLDLWTWLSALHKAQALLPQGPDELALSRALRRAFHLSRLMPDPILAVFATDCSEESYESLLDSGDLSGAALALLAPGLEIETSKPDGKVVVVIHASGIGATGTGVSCLPAAAILEAWYKCIFTAVASASENRDALNQDPHISQRAQHPPSSRH